MPKTTEALQKHTLNLREGDMDAIRDLVPDTKPHIVVRSIVSAFVDKHRDSVKPDLSSFEVRL